MAEPNILQACEPGSVHETKSTAEQEVSESSIRTASSETESPRTDMHSSQEAKREILNASVTSSDSSQTVDTRLSHHDSEVPNTEQDLVNHYIPSSVKESVQECLARSVSEGSSGSGSSHKVVSFDGSGRPLVGTSLVDSDTCSGSSASPRDGANSEVSSEDPLAELEAMRNAASSVMSDASSYSWMRDGAMGSVMSVDPDSALGRIRADLAKENAQNEPRDRVTSVELTNELIEGPTLFLPPEQQQSSKPAAETTDPPRISQVKTTPDSQSPREQESVSSESKTDNTAQPDPQSSSSMGRSEAVPSAVPTTAVAAKSSTSATESTSASREPTPAVSSISAANPVAKTEPPKKRTPNDFMFGKVIGEGSYSTVYLAKEVSTQKEFAIKVCEKKHLIRERKTHIVKREKEVFMKLDHPFFVRLAYTFQDAERLYYVITYARNGELLSYLHKLSVFDVPCTRFYSAEVILALDYLHNLGIVHRDLKPENILLSEDMHVKITDFGASKQLQLDENGKPIMDTEARRKNSFVGTAEYVSPEVLNNQPANFGSDLWALGCIIYQCLSGSMPFRSGNEYQTFQKIVKTEYTFPEGFNTDARDLVSRLLVLEPEERLGMPGTGGMSALKSHNFYTGVDWDNLPNSTPPKLMPYLPATSHNPEFWGQEHRMGASPDLVGFDDQRMVQIITGQSADGSLSPELEEVPVRGASPVDGFADGRSDETLTRQDRLQRQRRENQFHQYVEGNLILKQGFVDKRKGLFARKRMLLLTEGPHLYYVDAHHKVLKGEIPWSKYLRPEAKNFKIFFVHTPNRTYYLESRMPDAQMWVKKIKEVWKKYYGNSEMDDS